MNKVNVLPDRNKCDECGLWDDEIAKYQQPCETKDKQHIMRQANFDDLIHLERGRIWSAICDTLVQSHKFPGSSYQELEWHLKQPHSKIWRAFTGVRLHGIVWETSEENIQKYERMAMDEK